MFYDLKLPWPSELANNNRQLHKHIDKRIEFQVQSAAYRACLKHHIPSSLGAILLFNYRPSHERIYPIDTISKICSLYAEGIAEAIQVDVKKLHVYLFTVKSKSCIEGLIEVIVIPNEN